MNLPVISLWQPWAQWVVLGWKPIETRLHPRLVSLAGRRIAIHAAKKWDVSALQLADRYLTAAQIQQTWQFRDHGRNIIGTAFVSCHRELSAEDSAGALIDCGATKRYGLILESPMAITPILCKGKQGIWYYEIPA